MLNHSKDKINRFEAHPILTIFLFIIVFIVVFDFFAVNIYKLSTGHSWNEGQWIENKTEKTYRIKDNIYHHDLAKNKEIKNAVYRNYGYKVYTNSLGFKDKMVRNVAASSDNYRILFIGDSFTEGIGFDYEKTFVGLIDKELSNRRIEVLNAAVCSYSPMIYWRKAKYLIEDVGLKFNEMVVFIDMSDIIDEATGYYSDKNGNVMLKSSDNYLDKIDELETSGPPSSIKKIIKNFKSTIRDNSILLYPSFVKLRTKFNAFGHKEYTIHVFWALNKDIYNQVGEKGLHQCSSYMDKLHDLLKAHGIKLTVAVYPWPQQVAYNDLESIQKTYWKNWCKKNKVPFINYFPYFVSGKTEKDRNAMIDKYYMEGDCHLNEAGHKLVADVFLDFYRKQQAN